MNEGESASSKARHLRGQAAAALAESGRLTREAGAWEAGAEGERRVAEALSGLADDPNLVVIHDRLLRPGRSQANLDHIVVSPAGAYLIDAKNWAGNVNLYQGSLWRHKPNDRGGRSSECMNAQVDKVRRMAETMETISLCVVEPVLCLTGRSAQSFGKHHLIRGVHVVPVGQIAHWLAGRERNHPEVAVPVLAQKLEGLFPSATGPCNSLTPAPITGGKIGSNRKSESTPRRTNADAPRRTPRSSRRRGPEKHRAAKPLLGLLALTAMFLFGAPVLTWFALQVSTTVTHLATTPIGSSTNASGQPVPPRKVATPSGAAATPPCRVLTEAAISKALGVRVYPVATPLADTCQWGLRLDDQSTVVVRSTTGWFAAHNTTANKAKRAIYQDGLGSLDVSIIVPQFAAVPGSKVPKAQITQPMQISLMTNRLGEHGRKFSDDQARSLVTKWAQQVATAMPQGPGADSIRP